MELELVLERLKMTIDKLEGLAPENFEYDSFVSRFDYQKGCGTVCCVGGFYPIWGFCEALYYDRRIGALTCDPTTNISACLSEYHGVSCCLILTLFYGKTGYPHLSVYHDSLSCLSRVIEVWREVYTLLEKGEISPEFPEKLA